jgi:hypothetical protein
MALSTMFIPAPVPVRTTSLSLNASDCSAISFVIFDSRAPCSVISPIFLPPSASSGAICAHDLPNTIAPSAAFSCSVPSAANMSATCLNASSGSFAVMPSALNISALLPIV